jgi:imidazolonepropionase-like amidohydrolase
MPRRICKKITAITRNACCGNYVAAGLSPYEALHTGTVNIGRVPKQDDIGVIRTGALADLILLEADPLEGIRHTQRTFRRNEGGTMVSTFLDQQRTQEAGK